MLHRYNLADARYRRSYLDTDVEAIRKNLLPFEYYMLDSDAAGNIYLIDAPLFRVFRVDPETATTRNFTIQSRTASPPRALPPGASREVSEAAFAKSYFLDHINVTRYCIAVSVRTPGSKGFLLEALSPDGKQFLEDVEIPGRLVGKTEAGSLLIAAQSAGRIELREYSVSEPILPNGRKAAR